MKLTAAGLLLILLPGAATAECPSFGRTHRFDDDVSCLAGAPDSLKHIGLGDAYLSFGGELRERYEHADPPILGLTPATRSDVLLHRLLLQADVDSGAGVRAFVQLGDHLETGRPGGPSSTDKDTLDLQQGFVDATAGPFLLRVGRQEMAYGSQRLVTVREGPNIRQAFDGVRAAWHEGAARLDVFWTRPVLLKTGAFDDQSNPKQSFWGAYGTIGGIDLYYLGLLRKSARFDIGTGREMRHSAGTRVFGAKAGWDWDLEAVYQWGEFGAGRIAAWTTASIVGFSPGGAWRPRLWLSANVASGDHDRADATLGTFNPLFPRAPYFTEAAINAPANFMDLHPGVDFSPVKPLRVTVSIDVLWRESVHDAFYAQPIAPLIPGSSSTERFIGTQAELKGTWTVNRALSFTASYVHFVAGAFVTRARGHNEDFVAAWSTVRF